MTRGVQSCVCRAVELSGRGRESGGRRQPPTAGYFCPPVTKRPSGVSQTRHAWAAPGFVLKCRLQTENADSFFGAGVQLRLGFGGVPPSCWCWPSQHPGVMGLGIPHTPFWAQTLMGLFLSIFCLQVTYILSPSQPCDAGTSPCSSPVILCLV